MSILNSNISFVSMGKVIKNVNMTYLLNNNSKANVPQRENYNFIGWFSNEQNGTLIFDANGNYNPKASDYWSTDGKWLYNNNISVYAQWEKLAVEQELDPDLEEENLNDYENSNDVLETIEESNDDTLIDESTVSNEEQTNNSNNLLLILVAAISGTIVAVGIILFIIIKNKKKELVKSN